jgi:hypothetical protein
MQTYSLLLAPTYTVQLVPLDQAKTRKHAIPTRIREITQDPNAKYRDP